MTAALLTLAALAYAVGGLFMKQSNGATVPYPTLVFLGLFAVGATLQARAMRGGEMGTVYVVVLGLEAVAAVVLSAAVLHEPYTPSRLAAMLVIVAGIAWLRYA